MKFSFIISLNAFLLISCKTENNKTLSISEKKTFVSNKSKAVSVKKNSLFFNDQKFNGVVYELYENGDTLSIKKFSNGLQDGISKEWYSNNQLMETRNYEKGKKNGK